MKKDLTVIRGRAPARAPEEDGEALKHRLLALLAERIDPDILPPELQEVGRALGLKTYDDALIASLYLRALVDTRSLQYLHELTGQNPALKLKREQWEAAQAEAVRDPLADFGKII